MNRVKLTIKDDRGNPLCKIGTSIAVPSGREYSDAEISQILRDWACMFDTKIQLDRDEVATAEKVREVAKKKPVAEKQIDNAVAIAKAIDEGWTFEDNSYCHPHNNTYQAETYFQSKRMAHAIALRSTENVFDQEAKFLARHHALTYADNVQDTITKFLERYFRAFPTETFEDVKGTKISVEITL